MADEFTGNTSTLTDADFEKAATDIGCTVAAVRAVVQVESKGGFFADNRPKILFERHKFSSFTDNKFDKKNPQISSKSPGGYMGGPAEYDRLKAAIALDRSAALKSASWGAFQLMGFNHKICGFGNVEDFVKAMVVGETTHIAAFVKFVKGSGLGDELIRRDWAGFARGYNGANYAINHYDTKMAAAYEIFSRGGARTENPRPVLRIGDKGPAVVELQKALGLKPADGDFGPATKTAVVKLQTKKGLYPDGIVGNQTWKAALGTG